MRRRRRTKNRQVRFKYRKTQVPPIEELLSGLGLNPDEATPVELSAAVEGLTGAPAKITPEVKSLANRLSPDESPVFIPVKTVS
jgi:hypothetical protein